MAAPRQENDRLYALLIEALVTVQDALEKARADPSRDNVQAFDEALQAYLKASDEWRKRPRSERK